MNATKSWKTRAFEATSITALRAPAVVLARVVIFTNTDGDVAVVSGETNRTFAHGGGRFGYAVAGATIMTLSLVDLAIVDGDLTVDSHVAVSASTLVAPYLVNATASVAALDIRAFVDLFTHERYRG